MKRFLLCIVSIALVCVLVPAVGFLYNTFNAPKYVQPASVKIDGTLYYTYMKPAPTPPEESQITGYIRSCVAGTEKPTENDQSNFESCVGEPYAMVDGQLLLRANGVWYECVLPD